MLCIVFEVLVWDWLVVDSMCRVEYVTECYIFVPAATDESYIASYPLGLTGCHSVFVSGVVLSNSS